MKPAYELEMLVRIKDTQTEFNVEAIRLIEGRIFYCGENKANGESYTYPEEAIEKVIPKKTFYLWVYETNGKMYPYLLDEVGNRCDGNKVSTNSMRRVEGTGIDLPFKVKEPIKPKISARVEDDEDEDEDWD